MNRMCMVILVAAVLTLLTIGAAGQSAPSAAPAAQAQPGPAADNSGVRPGAVQRRVQWYAQNLDLTDEQKEKLQPIVADQLKDMKAISEDSSLSPDQKREKTQAARDKHRPAIEALLTAEQKEKFNKMREEALKPKTEEAKPAADQEKPKQ